MLTVGFIHLGHVFNAHLTDDDDILARRNSFMGQANSFFGLFKVYTVAAIVVPNCRNLTNNNLEAYCIVWRKSLGRLWSLPYNSSQLITALTSLTIRPIPLFDEMCRRATISFVHVCIAILFLSVPLYYMVFMCHILTHLSVEMRLFALYVTTLLLTIYSTLNLVDATVLHAFNLLYP